MITVIRAEFIKLKDTYLYTALLLASIFISIFSAGIVMQEDSLSIEAILSQSVILINYLIGVPLFSIITGLIFAREYEQETISYLCTSAYKRFEFLIAKMVLLLCLVCLTMGLIFVLNIIIGVVFSNEQPNLNEILSYAKLYLLTIAMQFSLIPLVIILTLIWRNYVISISIGIVAAFSIGIVAATPLGAFYPWSAPLFITYDILGLIDTYIYKHVVGLVFLFFSSILSSFIYFQHREIK